jgi:ABC transport system ATP-binding/permease protein
MNRSAPVLTVRSGRSQGSFAAGRDVVVGTGLKADLRVAHPLVAHEHVVLRFEQGRWIALDNHSPNGMYVSGERVPTVDIEDGLTINIGKPEGPRITFEVRQNRGMGGPPATEDSPAPAPTRPPRTLGKSTPRHRPATPRSAPPSGQPPESA